MRVLAVTAVVMLLASVFIVTAPAVSAEEMPESPPADAGMQSATPADEKGSLFELNMTKGIVSFVNEDYRGAEENFRAALDITPDSFEATLYLGMALSRQLGKEAEYVIKKALIMDPGQQRATFELGLYYFKKGIYAEALDFFEITMDLDPKSAIAAEAAEHIQKIEKAWSKRRWEVNFETGFQYDTNVALSSSDSAASGTSGAADLRNYLSVGGGYDFIRLERLWCNAGYSFYRSMHLELGDYDATAHDFTLRASYDLPREASLDVSYSYGFDYVGQENYSATHTLRPSLLIPEGKDYSAVVQFSYRESRFGDSALFKKRYILGDCELQTNSDRSGRDLEFAIAQYIPLAENMRTRLGYAYDSASADKDYWSHTGHRGFAVFDIVLPYKLTAGLTGEYRMEDYEGNNPITGGKRQDRIQTYSLLLRYALSEKAEVSARQSFIAHGSNIAVYDYTRAISSLSVSLRL